MEHKVWACAHAVNLFSTCRMPSLGQGPPLCPGVPLSYGLLCLGRRESRGLIRPTALQRHQKTQMKVRVMLCACWCMA